MHLGALRALHMMTPLGYVRPLPGVFKNVLRSQGMTDAEITAATKDSIRQRFDGPKRINLEAISVAVPTDQSGGYQPTDEEIDDYLRSRETGSDSQAIEAASVPIWVWVAGGVAAVGVAVWFGSK